MAERGYRGYARKNFGLSLEQFELPPDREHIVSHRSQHLSLEIRIDGQLRQARAGRPKIRSSPRSRSSGW
jgi:hypothetical protein